MVAGMARVVQDVLPFTIAEGFPAHMRVINKVGMERAGYAGDDIKAVRKAFRILFAESSGWSRPLKKSWLSLATPRMFRKCLPP